VLPVIQEHRKITAADQNASIFSLHPVCTEKHNVFSVLQRRFVSFDSAARNWTTTDSKLATSSELF